jgi:hypothetical protein
MGSTPQQWRNIWIVVGAILLILTLGLVALQGCPQGEGAPPIVHRMPLHPVS